MYFHMKTCTKLFTVNLLTYIHIYIHINLWELKAINMIWRGACTKQRFAFSNALGPTKLLQVSIVHFSLMLKTILLLGIPQFNHMLI